MLSLKKYPGLHENGVKLVKMAIQNGGQPIFILFFQGLFQWEKLMTNTIKLIQNNISSNPMRAESYKVCWHSTNVVK